MKNKEEDNPNPDEKEADFGEKDEVEGSDD